MTIRLKVVGEGLTSSNTVNVSLDSCVARRRLRIARKTYGCKRTCTVKLALSDRQVDRLPSVAYQSSILGNKFIPSDFSS